jgi:hypothetical protein
MSTLNDSRASYSEFPFTAFALKGGAAGCSTRVGFARVGFLSPARLWQNRLERGTLNSVSESELLGGPPAHREVNVCTISNPPLKELSDDIGVEAPTLKKCIIEPEEKGITYRLCGAYRLRLKSGLTQIYMVLPTLEMSIRVEAPSDYGVFANNADNQNQNFWQYNTIRMQGDHVILRWRQKGKEWG